MRPNPLLDTLRPTEELIAGFGGATITRSLDRQLHIRGGTEQERAKAQAWMDRFLTRKPYPPEKKDEHGP